jgi:DNA-binding MarR family transcriptional regulator
MIEITSSSVDRAETAKAVSLAVMRWQDATQAYDEAVGARLGLIAAERHCLGLLYGGPQSAGAVATATGLTPAAVTALIDRLEARGLVTRTRSLEDRRKVVIEATERTRALSQRYYGPIAEEGEKVIAGLADAELAVVLRFIEAALDLQNAQLARLKAEAPEAG